MTIITVRFPLGCFCYARRTIYQLAPMLGNKDSGRSESYSCNADSFGASRVSVWHAEWSCYKRRRFLVVGLLLDCKKTCSTHVVIEEEVDNIGAIPETLPSTSLASFAQLTNLSASSARSATSLLRMHPCNTAVIHKFYDTSWNRSECWRCTNPLAFCSEMKRGLISVITWTLRITFTGLNPHKIALHDIKVGVWCAMSATWITGAANFWHFLNRCVVTGEPMPPFQQGSVTADTVPCVVLERVLVGGFFFPPDLNSWDFACRRVEG